MKLRDLVILSVSFNFMASGPAHAYLDGATVSIVLQAIAGGVASLLIFGKMFWARIKSVFTRSKPEEGEGRDTL